jgi:hypothetical protein
LRGKFNSFAKVQQTRVITKKKNLFFSFYYRVPPTLSKGTANESNNKEKNKFFSFYYREPPTLSKGTANESNNKEKKVFFESPVKFCAKKKTSNSFK